MSDASERGPAYEKRSEERERTKGAVSDPLRGVLDTNAVVLYGRLDLNELPATPQITAVTLAELSVGPLVIDDPDERARRQAHVQLAEASLDPLPFDSDAARAFGALAASLHASGRKQSARAFDAMIAATAISRGLPLYTCNTRDFTGIDGLDLRRLTHPDSLGVTPES